jgi:uncharacterized protein YxeA
VSENFIQGVRRDTRTQIQYIEKEDTNTFAFFVRKEKSDSKKARLSEQAQKENRNISVYMLNKKKKDNILHHVQTSVFLKEKKKKQFEVCWVIVLS